ncbi:MAG: translocation/assembly module TamB domain-containing protein, partial [Burkholderiaceae bacterium]|nr:translocation/assembly module TamB domain-containing protein [Burkholderiaceae bacterium]
VRSAMLDLRRRGSDADALDLSAFDLQLGNATQTAGRVHGKGDWTAEGWTVNAALKDIKPTQLDARLAKMHLGGSLTVQGRGFANPLLTTPAAPTTPEVELRAALNGQLLGNGPGRSVGLLLDGRGSKNEIELRKLHATAGGATLLLTGRTRHSASEARWRVVGNASLKDFDPVLWLPGREGSPWQRGPHRLNAQATWDLGLPQTMLRADQAGLVSRLSALRGTASLTLADSLLAGVPLTGSVALHGVKANMVQTSVRLTAAGNAFTLDGVLDAARNGRGDRWTLQAQAPAIARLAPALRLAGITALDGELTGTLSGNARADGRWPLIATEGTLDASQIRMTGASVMSGQARWRLDTKTDAPAELNLALSQAALGPLQIDSLHAQLQGTTSAHTLTLSAQAQGSPPGWVRLLRASEITTDAAAESTLATVKAHGSLVTQLNGKATAPLWRGVIEQFELRASAPSTAVWLHTKDLHTELQLASSDKPARVSLSAGRAELLGAGLRWDGVQWQAGLGARQQRIELHAELDPLPVAPWLSRLQPDFGWGGDLHISGEITLRSAEQFNAEVVLQRQRGDLSVADEAGTQRLGLTDLRLALDARNGLWSFTQALAGSNVGVAAGAITLRTAPESNWPAADTPIQGVLEAQVANLGAWGPWVPPGWRLTGKLGATASIGGRFGAPEFTGEVRGSGIGVRNLLEGVNVTEGELQVALKGDAVHIERAQAKSGAGSLRIEGSANLKNAASAAARAQMQITADKFQLLGRVDRRIVASGQGLLQLEDDAIKLNGKFKLDEGLIDFTRADAPSLSDDVAVSRDKDSDASNQRDGAKPAASPYAVVLDLSVDLGENLRVRGRGLDTGLRGQIRLTTPGGRLAVHGNVRTEGGTYAAYGQKLSIDRGVISFTGALENPRLDIEATRPDSEVRVGVAINGNALDPRVRLFSEPEMSETDKLSHLVLGRGSDNLGGAETALLRRAAMALFSGEGEGTVEKLTRTIGLDELSVRGTEGDVRETIVTLGKQLSRRWYVGYERSLNATTGTWQLIHRAAEHFTLRAQS